MNYDENRIVALQTSWEVVSQTHFQHDLSSLKTIAIMNSFLLFLQRWIALIRLYNSDYMSENHIWLLIEVQVESNCTNFRIQNEFWWLIESKITYYFFENLNSQLMKVIDFKKYERKIDQNSFRSIIRVKRIYWIFFYRMCSMTLLIKINQQRAKRFRKTRNKCSFFRFLSNL